METCRFSVTPGNTQLWPSIVWCQHLSLGWLVFQLIPEQLTSAATHRGPWKRFVASHPLNPLLISATAAIYTVSYFKPKPCNFPLCSAMVLRFANIHPVHQQAQRCGGLTAPRVDFQRLRYRSWWTNAPKCLPQSRLFWGFGALPWGGWFHLGPCAYNLDDILFLPYLPETTSPINCLHEPLSQALLLGNKVCYY